MKNKLLKFTFALVVFSFLFFPQGDVLGHFSGQSKIYGSSLSTASFDFSVDYSTWQEIDSRIFEKDLTIKNIGTIDAKYRLKITDLNGEVCGDLTLDADFLDEAVAFEEGIIHENILDVDQEKKLTLEINGQEVEGSCSFNLQVEGAQKKLDYGQGFTYFKEIENDLEFKKPLPQVVINEVYYNIGDQVVGNSPDEKNKWIELYNLSDEDIYIEGWQIQSTEAEKSRTITNNPNDYISANGFIILSHDASTCAALWDCNGASHFNLGGSPFAGWMSEDGDTLTLFDDMENEIDFVTWTGDDAGEEKSYARIPDGEDDWQESCPTPGEKNKEDNCQNLNQQIQTESSPQEIQTDNIEEDKVDEKEDLKDDSDKDDHQDDPSKEEENKEEEKKENEEKVDLQEFSRSISQTEEESKETGSKEDPQSVEAVDLKEEEPEELKDKEKEAEETEKREAVNIKETEEETEGEKLNDDQNE